MRLRQIVLVAQELRPVEQEILTELGLEVCYRDPGLAAFGLRHGLYPIGDQLLEVVAPRTDGTTAGRFLERRGGDGGYMVIVQVDDLDAERERLAGTDIRIVYEAENRLGSNHVQGLHLHPRDVGGAILSIDAADPAPSWAWAGTDWEFHALDGVVSAITAVELQADDPAVLAAQWSAALGRPVDASDGHRIILADAEIRFVASTDDRGPGITAFDLAATDASRRGTSLVLGGATFHLV